MFCTKCGNNNPEGALFCVACGAAMVTPEPQRQQQMTSMPENVQKNEFAHEHKTPEVMKNKKKKKKKLKVFVIIAVVLVIIIGLAGAAFCLLGANISPKTTVTRIEEAVRDADAEDALYALVPRGAKYVIIEQYFDGDAEAFEDALEDIEHDVEKYLDNRNIKFKNVELMGNLKDADEEMDERIKSEMKELYGVPVNEVKTGRVKVTYKQYGERKEEKIDCYFYRTVFGWSVYYPDWEYVIEELADEY